MVAVTNNDFFFQNGLYWVHNFSHLDVSTSLSIVRLVPLDRIVIIITVMMLTIIVMILEMKSLTFFSANARRFVGTRACMHNRYYALRLGLCTDSKFRKLKRVVWNQSLQRRFISELFTWLENVEKKIRTDAYVIFALVALQIVIRY